MMGIEWTSDIDAEAIRREVSERERVREYVQHARERGEEQRQWMRHRLVSALTATGVAVGGVAVLAWLLVGWLL
jgi:hypothetical protein